LYQYGLLNPVRLTDPDGRLEYDGETDKFMIQRRDTLSSISKETGVGINQLLGANPDIKDRDKIYAGKNINIPETTNIQAFKWAVSTLGSKDYATEAAAPIDGFAASSNKCNLYCAHAYEKGAQVEFPHRYVLGGTIRRGPVSAGDLATAAIPGTSLVDISKAWIGDVIAWKRDFTGATGHSTIFTGFVDIKGQPRPPAEWGTIGASSDMVRYRTQGYLEGNGYTNPGIRRIGP